MIRLDVSTAAEKSINYFTIYIKMKTISVKIQKIKLIF